MKCREAQFWLYSFRPNASWPVDVVGHLQQCQACQQLQAQLKQIDQGVDKLTSKPGKPSAKTHLLDLIEQTPQSSAAPKPGWALSWARPVLALTAAAALIAFGWFLGRHGEIVEVTPGDTIETIKTVEVIREKTVEVFRDKIVSVHSQADLSLFAALLKRNARLVQTTQLPDRLDTLLDMADDCRQHALTLIAKGPRDSLPLTIDLHTQLLREGVLGQLAQAAPASRVGLRQAVRTRLDQMSKPPEPMPMALPRVLIDQREILLNVARQTIELLNQPQDALPPAKTKRPQRHEPIAPATALVQFAITYSSESDPVAKADFCADYVQQLMPSMMLYLAEDSSPQRVEMGQQFGEMIQFGIYRPLEAASAQEAPQPVKDQAERIFQHAAQTVANLEKHLEEASKDARPGLQRAVEATKKGWEKNKSKGKGKGRHGKDDANKGPRNIQGVLKSVDGARLTITVSSQLNGQDAERTFALTKNLLGSPLPSWERGWG